MRPGFLSSLPALLVLAGVGTLGVGSALTELPSATSSHDVVVAAPRPLKVTIPATKSAVEKKLLVKVTDADPAGDVAQVVRLQARDGDCPAGTVAGAADFGKKAAGPSDAVVLEPGKSATARVALSIAGVAFTSYNARAPQRCAIEVEATTQAAGNADPTPWNNTAPVEIDVIDGSDPEQGGIGHETVLGSLRPLRVVIGKSATGASKQVRPKVSNADVVPESEAPGHEITVAAHDGDCPAGTVGAIDFDPRAAGAQSSIVLDGGKSAAARLGLAIAGAEFLTWNLRAPMRCTAVVRASGPAGNVEPEASNDATRLVIDVVDKGDAGAPTPTPAPTATVTPTPTATPTPSPTPSGAGLPPEPSQVAPALDPTVATDLFAATEFLYTGAEPIQTGVAPGTIDARRVAVVRGRVLDAGGAALSGVAVSILGHAELGQTRSRLSGGYDLAVNGGGPLTVVYAKEGVLPAQRTVEVPWREWVAVDDVVLVALDAPVTVVETGPGAAQQVARGSAVTDAHGTRRATLLFPAGTGAELVMPDGSTVAVSSLSVRATEYTVGALGLAAMPAGLPPTSQYTYAVELSADEALAAGATRVDLSQPVLFYLENFLGFPVGIQVPMGSYDPAAAAWVPSADGRVIGILGVDGGGRAELDTTGDGLADNGVALGVSDAERAALAGLYPVGQTLWRVAVSHFTSYDPNYGVVPEDGAVPPRQPPASGGGGGGGGDRRGGGGGSKPDDACPTYGSYIECENQVLNESVGIVGTPYRLHYASDRVPGRVENRTLAIPLSGATIPANLRRIDLTIEVAGRRVEEGFAPAPDLVRTFVWDGRDAYGRLAYGEQPVTVTVGWVYDGFYALPPSMAASFGFPSGVPVPGDIPARAGAVLAQVHHLTVGGGPSRDLGGWTLGVHHVYDPTARVLHLGNGSRRSARSLHVDTMAIVAGTGADGFGGDGGPATQADLQLPRDVAVAPDGGFYVADSGNHRVRHVAPDGTITTVAGTGTAAESGDGGPATAADLLSPAGLDVGPDGSVYVGSEVGARIRRIAPDGTITTVVGTGTAGFSGDGGPATAARLAAGTYRVAVAPDGTIYVADTWNQRIRRVAPGGGIETFAGTGAEDFGGDGGPARLAELARPSDVALGPDGSVYIADRQNQLVRRVGPDGIITTVAGVAPSGYASARSGARLAARSLPERLAAAVHTAAHWLVRLPEAIAAGVGGDEGLPAAQVTLVDPDQVAVAPDGTLFVGDNEKIRVVDTQGILTTLAGGGTEIAEGMPAAQAYLDDPGGMDVAPDGSLYFADPDAFYAAPPGVNGAVVRRIAPPLPGFTAGQILIPSADASRLFVFAASGRHLRTLDAFTGATLFELVYTPAGLLAGVRDRDGDATTVERDPSGKPTAIVAPFGQRTALMVDANGYLASITNPESEAVELVHDAGGLLRTMIDANTSSFGFAYDALGRLARDEDPAGGVQALARTEIAGGHVVDRTTGLGRTTRYQLERPPAGGQRRLNTFPSGTQAEVLVGTDGSRTSTVPDGTETATIAGPDPRFAMQAPLSATETTTMPSGLTRTITTDRAANLGDPSNPLSLITLTETVDQNGRAWTTVYDAATRTFTTTTPEGRHLTRTIDGLGRLVAQQIGTLDPLALSYDGHGRLASLTRGSGPEERKTLYAYDAAGFVESIAQPLGRVTRLGYDLAGRVVTQTLPGSRVVGLGYDDNGNLTSVTPPGRPAHLMTHTPVNLLSAYLPPDLGGTLPPMFARYDVDRDLTRITRPDGTLREFAYDAAGRLETETLPSGARGYTYDPGTGRLITISTPGGISLGYGYDGDLITATTWTGPVPGAVARTHDDDLRLTELRVNGGNLVTFAYDDDGLLTQAGALTLTRHPEHGLIMATALGGVADVRTYNGFGEMETYAASFGATGLYAFEHTYDQLGRIVTSVETVAGATDTHDYEYDAAGRLMQVRDNGAPIAAYGYDDNGNRLSFTDPGGTISGTYDEQDRLVDYAGATYTYTDDGELLSKVDGPNTTTYAYDARGNLTAVTLPDATHIDYLVDGMDRRVGKKIDGILVKGFLYQSRLRPVAELDGTGALVSLFVYGSRVNVPEYMVRDGTTYRLLSDHLGSMRLVVEVTTGAIAQRIDYDTFGRVVADTNPGFQPFGFAGGLYDPDTKLVRFGVRDYDAQAGRWTARDPILFWGGQVNLHAYVFNDPVNLTDPSGGQAAVDQWEGGPPVPVDRSSVERGSPVRGDPVEGPPEFAPLANGEGRSPEHGDRFGSPPGIPPELAPLATGGGRSPERGDRFGSPPGVPPEFAPLANGEGRSPVGGDRCSEKSEPKREDDFDFGKHGYLFVPLL